MKKSFIVFTFISFVLFEMFMYLYGAIFSNYGIRDDNYGYRYFKNIQIVFNYKNELINFSTNNYGYRDKTWNFESKEINKRIAVIGDSIVSALGTHRDRRFTEILEKKLSKGENNYQILNMGINGQSVINHINSTDSIIKEINPDYIFVVLSTTDDFDGKSHKTFLNSKKLTYLIKNQEVVNYQEKLNIFEDIYRKILVLIRQSSTINQVHNTFNFMKFKFIEFTKPSLTENTEKSDITEQDQKCKNSGFKSKTKINLVEKIIIDINKIAKNNLILLLSPSEQDFLSKKESIISCEDKIHVFTWFDEFTKRQKIRTINIHNKLNNKNNIFSDGAHYNDYGHSLVAEIIYKEFINLMD